MTGRATARAGFGFLVFAPTVWLVQFVAGYVMAAVHCQRFAATGLAPLRLLILGLVILALGLIGAHALRSMALYRELAGAADPTDELRRRRFIGAASLLLALLSGIATLLGSLPILMLDDCT